VDGHDLGTVSPTLSAKRAAMVVVGVRANVERVEDSAAVEPPVDASAATNRLPAVEASHWVESDLLVADPAHFLRFRSR